MITIDVPIVACEGRCHTKIIPPHTTPNVREEYPPGTCPYYRQMPRGDGKICILFQQHVHGDVSLSVDTEGFALRTTACIVAEERSGQKYVLRIDLPATATSCENKPIHKELDKKEADALRNDPKTTCPLYIEYVGGSSLCTLGNRFGEVRRILFLKRQDNGFTPRIRDCLQSEIQEKQRP